MEIIPAILANSSADFKYKIDLIKADRKFDWVQIDIIDGDFAGNKTIFPENIEDYYSDNLLFDFHLMVKNPFSWIERCVETAAQRIVGQIEMMDNQFDFIDRVKSEGVEAGLAIDIDTPIDKISKDILFQSDIVVVMSVKAGFSGQKFDHRSLAKVEQLVEARSQIGGLFKIAVDGGLNQKNIRLVESAGGDICYVGSYFWNSFNA